MVKLINYSKACIYNLTGYNVRLCIYNLTRDNLVTGYLLPLSGTRYQRYYARCRRLRGAHSYSSPSRGKTSSPTATPSASTVAKERYTCHKDLVKILYDYMITIHPDYMC